MLLCSRIRSCGSFIDEITVLLLSLVEDFTSKLKESLEEIGLFLELGGCELDVLFLCLLGFDVCVSDLADHRREQRFRIDYILCRAR